MAKIKRDTEQSLNQAAPIGIGQHMEQVGIDLTSTGTQQPTRVEPSPRFLYAVHPERWLVMDGKLVPATAKLKLVNGLENAERIDSRQAGVPPRWVLRNTVASWEARGWTIIPLDVDGPGTSYLRSPTGRPDVCLSRWERVYSGSTVIDSDLKGYSDWLAGLIKRGVIRPCPVYVIERMIADREKRRGELADRVHATPSLQVELRTIDADLAVLREALAAAPRSAVPDAGEAIASLE